VQLTSFGDLRIVGSYGGTGDDDVSTLHVFSDVAFEDDSAQRSEPLRNRGTLEIGTRDLIAQVQQDFGNATHADAADAYEMDTLNFGKHDLAYGYSLVAGGSSFI
jgi:hypothetical protein